MFYEDVFRSLNKHKVKYVVVGGTAVNLHGVPRFTADLDIIIDLEKKNVLRFSDAFRDINFKPKVPVKLEDFSDEGNRKSWIENKGAVVFSLHNMPRFDRTVYVFIKNPIDFVKLDQAKLLLNVSGIKIPVVGLDHLIQLKKLANRKQDISDIEALNKVKQLESGK